MATSTRCFGTAVTTSVGIHFLSAAQRSSQCPQTHRTRFDFTAVEIPSSGTPLPADFSFPHCNICVPQTLSRRHRPRFSPLRWSKGGIKAEISKDMWGFNGCWFQEWHVSTDGDSGLCGPIFEIPTHVNVESGVFKSPCMPDSP